MTSRAAAAILLAVFLLAGNAGAEVLTARITFDAPTFVRAPNGLLCAVAGCRSIGDTGEPMLPVFPARFILPPGERVVRVTVEPESEIEIAANDDLVPMPAQAPPGAPAPRSLRNESTYASAGPVPFARGALAAEHVASGIRIAFINVYPCVYTPAARRLLFAPAVRVTVETAPRPAPEHGTPPPRPGRALDMLRGRLQNPADAGRYRTPTAADAGAGELAHYVIITAPDFVEAFGPLAALRERCGMRVRVVDTAWIDASFGGTDLQAKIRAFITFAYAQWGTEYVLLGGDDEIIPHRGLYVKAGTTVDADIASDLYYACLDGSWNGDGDAYYGEPGEEDLIPEVRVGRLPVDSPLEIASAVQKIAAYTFSPVVPQCESALMLGELLWSIEGVDTWGGDYKDEIRFGAASWGFMTAGVPASFAVSALYDRDLGSWSAAQILARLNGGVHLVNHAGHANLYEVMRLTPAEIPLLVNDGAAASFFVCWSHGCYAASFDNRDDAGAVNAADCIGEELVTGPCGAVAFVGHTRLAWDAPGSTCGVSQLFDRQFFDALFGENRRRIGDALDDARLDNISYISYDAVRWVYYTLCLLGDPALGVWTSAPRALAAAYDSVAYEGQGAFAVRVSDDRGPVTGARAVLSSTTPPVYCAATTDAAGEAVLGGCSFAAGTLLLSIESPEHIPFCDTITVAPSAEFLASARLVGVRDDSLSGCAGDGDGTAEPGERVSLLVELSNPGRAPLTGVTVTVASADTSVRIRDGLHFAADLPAAASVMLDTAFAAEVPVGAGSGLVQLSFIVTSNEGSWIVPQHLAVSAAAVVLESWEIGDTAEGNGNGCLEAWEFQTLRCFYRNASPIDLQSPVLTLSMPVGAAARVIRGTALGDDLPPGAVFDSGDELLWFVAEATPPFTPVTLVLSLEARNAPARRDTITVRTCGVEIDDGADNEGRFEHGAIVGPDQWHVTAERFHSAPASWKCGGPAGSTYANIMESTLTLPPLCLYSGSSFSFWHRMSAEAGSSYPYWALDAGVAEISIDGGRSWTIITPVAPYPSRASPYNTIFLPPYQRCWSGAFDWRMETFDLSTYSGPVLIRLHFASDEQRGFEGWYVDDVRVTTVVPADADDGGERPLATRLEPAYPNPFNPATTIAFTAGREGPVEIEIFDVAGRLVRTLVAGRVEAGRRTVVWNGLDESGTPASSGVYFCRLSAGAYTATTRLVLVR